MNKKIIFSVLVAGTALGAFLMVSAATRDIVFSPQASDPYTCNASTSGALYYKNDNKLYSCNGSAWAQVGGVASGGSVSTSSALSAYNFPYWANTTGGLMGTSTIFYASSTGNIGIGTTNPASLLHLESTSPFVQTLRYANTGGYGQIYFERALAGPSAITAGATYGVIRFRGYDGSGYKDGAMIVSDVDDTPGSNDMPGNLRFMTTPNGTTSTVDRMVIKNDGTIGIGTSTPAYTLDVLGTGRFTGTVSVGTPVSNGHAATKAYVDTVLGAGTTVTENPMAGDDHSTYYPPDGNTYTAGQKFMTNKAGTITKLRVIAANGAALTLKLWDANTQAVLATATTTGAGAGVWVEAAVNVSTTVSGVYTVTYTATNAGFYYGNQACPTYTGNYVRGGISVQNCGFSSSAAYPSTWNYSMHAVDVTFTYTQTVASQWVTTSSNAIYYNSGSVSIGTTDPSVYKLRVVADIPDYMAFFHNDGNNSSRSGIVIAGGTDDNSGNNYHISFHDGDYTNVGYIRSTGGVTTYSTNSDRRLKENIVPTILGLDTLAQIKVRDFNFISNPEKTRLQGFIAQELFEVYPEAVSVGDDEHSWGVDYGKLTPLILRSVQELDQETQEKMNLLIAENGELKLKNKDLESRILILEQKIK